MPHEVQAMMEAVHALYFRIDDRGMPIQGLERVIGRFGDGYAAWMWLTSELASLDGATPLALLAGGEVDRVANAAEGDRQGDFA